MMHPSSALCIYIPGTKNIVEYVTPTLFHHLLSSNCVTRWVMILSRTSIGESLYSSRWQRRLNHAEWFPLYIFVDFASFQHTDYQIINAPPAHHLQEQHCRLSTLFRPKPKMDWLAAKQENSWARKQPTNWSICQWTNRLPEKTKNFRNHHPVKHSYADNTAAGTAGSFE